MKWRGFNILLFDLFYDARISVASPAHNEELFWVCSVCGCMFQEGEDIVKEGGD
jgi:hypothetical protein